MSEKLGIPVTAAPSAEIAVRERPELPRTADLASLRPPGAPERP